MMPAGGQETALDAYARETLQRLPLADATLSLWAFVLQPFFLEEVFLRYRGRSFEDTLTFPVFVELIGEALLQHAGSGRRSFARAKEQGLLPTSIEAVYGKLRRVPLQGLAVAMAADPDGEANEFRLLPQLLDQARRGLTGPRLWVLDRQFCDL